MLTVDKHCPRNELGSLVSQVKTLPPELISLITDNGKFTVNITSPFQYYNFEC